MADTFSLSLWYQQLQLSTLDGRMGDVLRQFASHGGESGVFSTTVWPVNWREAAVFQQIYGLGEHACQIDFALEEAFEFLHADYAYELQIGWLLWEPEWKGKQLSWEKRTRLIRVIGYGPEFDDGAYVQDGHIRIDFGSDEPFLQENVDLDEQGLLYVEENIRQLIALTSSIEKETEPQSRLLWSELGETLASRLTARLNKVQ